jgi:hypothetical protein
MEKRKYPREFLLKELKRVAKLLGKIPTMEEFDKKSEIAAVTLAKRFNGWKSALSSAGFDPDKSRLTYQDIDMIGELKRVEIELNRTPSTSEFDQMSSMSSSTLIQRLGGSWDKACRAAGLKPYVSAKPPKPPAGWNKGQRKLNISKEELQYLYDVEGLSASSIAIRLSVHRNTVLRTMKEFGIDVKKYTLRVQVCNLNLIF